MKDPSKLVYHLEEYDIIVDTFYRACPTVQEYVIVATKYQTVEIFRRTPQTWTYDAYGPGDVLEITSLDVRIPVAALYRNAGVPETFEDLEGEV